MKFVNVDVRFLDPVQEIGQVGQFFGPKDGVSHQMIENRSENSGPPIVGRHQVLVNRQLHIQQNFANYRQRLRVYEQMIISSS